MKPSAVFASLRQLASLPIPGEMAQSTVLLLLRDLIGAETSTLLWLDEDCNLRNVHSNHLCSRELADTFISRYLNRQEAEVYTPHRRFMHGTARYDLLHAGAASYDESPFFHEFAKPMGFRYVSRFAVRNQGKPLASLWLTRPAGDKSFTATQLRHALMAMPYIEHALARDASTAACSTSADESGWLLARRDGSIVSLAQGTEALLHMAAHIPRNRATVSDQCFNWARPVLQRLLSQLAGMERGTDAVIPAITIDNPSGRYILRAYRMQDAMGGGADVAGVQITRHIPLALRLLAAPRVRALPAREKQVCLLLAEGLSTTQAAAQMGISPGGVIQHVRSLYNRLGIHQREELLGALLPQT